MDSAEEGDGGFSGRGINISSTGHQAEDKHGIGIKADPSLSDIDVEDVKKSAIAHKMRGLKKSRRKFVFVLQGQKQSNQKKIVFDYASYHGDVQQA